MNAFRQWVAKSRLMQNCVRPFDRRADIGLKAMARLSMRPLFPSRFRVQDFGKRFIRYDYRTGGILVNTGDYVQSIATERAIRKVMGDDVVFTPEVRGLLSCYDGEPAICVMQGWYEVGTLTFLPNERILPVWVGTHFADSIRPSLTRLVKLSGEGFFDQEIGCRDRSTMAWCAKNGIAHYFSRCLTLTLDRRETAPAEGKGRVFAVGPDAWVQALLPRLPAALRERVEVLDQLEPTDPHPLAGEHYLDSAERLLRRYREEASLVISSRLHCAQPCAAMGIPVVFIDPDDRGADRFSAMEGLLPVWSQDDLAAGRVDFNPQPIEIEALKKDMLENLRLSIHQALGRPIDRAELKAVRARIQAFHA